MDEMYEIYDETNFSEDNYIAVKKNDCYGELKPNQRKGLRLKHSALKYGSNKKIVVALSFTIFALALLLGAVVAITVYEVSEISKMKAALNQVETANQRVTNETVTSIAMLQQQSVHNDSTLDAKITAMANQIREINITLNCGGIRGWRKVGYLDMTDPSQSCPSGLLLKTYSPGLRSCGRASNSPGCWSTFYNTSGSHYSKVCGRVRGYQFGNTGAFHNPASESLNGYYVHGISLTTTSSSEHRTHIWTFAAGLSEVYEDRWAPEHCPCATSSASLPPSFVQNDYFCGSGLQTPWLNSQQHILYPDNPLWNGENCVTSCCKFNNPPYFIKTLRTPTSDQIELRVCSGNSADSDSPIDQLELYVSS